MKTHEVDLVWAHVRAVSSLVLAALQLSQASFWQFVKS